MKKFFDKLSQTLYPFRSPLAVILLLCLMAADGTFSNSKGTITLYTTGVSAATYTAGTFTVDTKGRITAASSSGAIVNGSLFYSPASAAAQSTVTTNAVTQTNGSAFQATSPMTITGARYYYPDSTSRTVAFSLWQCTNSTCGTNSKVASASASISGAGVHTISFGTPYSLATANTFHTYIVSYSVTSAAFYWRYNNNNAAPGGAFYQTQLAFGNVAMYCVNNGPNICWFGQGYWVGASDTAPTSGPNGEFNPIEPIWTVP